MRQKQQSYQTAEVRRIKFYFLTIIRRYRIILLIFINNKIDLSFLKGCAIETGVYISEGNNVVAGGMIVENGQNECAWLCSLYEECVAWTFKVSWSKCWLKSDDSSKGKDDDWITGTKECENRGMRKL